jgi:hypothetical protein
MWAANGFQCRSGGTMAMDPKQLGALVDREKKKTDNRARPPLRFYDAKNRHSEKEDLPLVEMTGDDVEQDAKNRAFAQEQEELQAKYQGAEHQDEELPEDPNDITPLEDLLE